MQNQEDSEPNHISEEEYNRKMQDTVLRLKSMVDEPDMIDQVAVISMSHVSLGLMDGLLALAKQDSTPPAIQAEISEFVYQAAYRVRHHSTGLLNRARPMRILDVEPNVTPDQGRHLH